MMNTTLNIFPLLNIPKRVKYVPPVIHRLVAFNMGYPNCGIIAKDHQRMTKLGLLIGFMIYNLVGHS